MSPRLNSIVGELWLWCTNPGGRTPSRGSQYNCRQRVSSDERSIRLDTEPQGLSQDSTEVGPTGSGHVCIQADISAEEVLDAFNQDWGSLQGRGYANFPWNLQ